MLNGRAIGAAGGWLADRLLGEPGVRPHPVAAFGSAMATFERWAWRDSRLAGTLHAGGGTGLGVLAGAAVRAGLGAGLPSTLAATYVAVAGRRLGEAATDVAAALGAGDVDAARELLRSLVGRDPTALDEKEIVRAVVESVAENTVDAVVAPMLWAVAAGAPGVLGYRAVNTVDAMVGQRSPRYCRYGWAGARLDDLAAWVPARVTAAAVVAVRPSAAGAVWRAVHHDAPGHPSPNAGVAEAAFAAALGLRLGGENRYGDRVEVRPPLGTGRPPEVDDVAAAVRLSSDVGAALAVLLFGTATVARWRRWRL
ncbi:MAG TPA: adenosylcobinamide-phosphate synthase CbiB [Acidimicrobiales bacterium]|jgi:adenosylcobinamide-phosphate synthase|nr:adenosylcobinamide-phosphate synthase CbiB [Acidimicrobiales bacterium]